MLFHQNSRSARLGPAHPAFAQEVLAGLSALPRAIPSRWLYDRTGSQLCEAITMLPDFYITRYEQGLLATYAPAIALKSGSRVLVEFGPGSSIKTPILLEAMKPTAYVPIDISTEFLWESAERLSYRYPYLPIYPIGGDLNFEVQLPCGAKGSPALGYFPASVIGNTSPEAMANSLKTVRRTLGANALILIGIDHNRHPALLMRAYDDAQGVTAAFNLNLLHRINRELDGTIPVDAFRHVVRWNVGSSCIEMYLEAIRDVDFTVAGRPFAMSHSETLHTQDSYKYDCEGAGRLLRAGGWDSIVHWTDRDERLALILAGEHVAQTLGSEKGVSACVFG